MRLLRRGSILIFFSGLITFTTVKAQNALVDSLVSLADKSTDAKIRADLFHRAASETWDYNFEKGLSFAERSLEAAREVDYKKGIAIALSDIGLYHYFDADYANARNLYQEALREAQEEPGAYHSTLYIRLGNLHRESSRFDSARMFYTRAAKFVNHTEPSRALALLYHNLGWMDYDLMRYNSARQYFRKALSIRESLRDSLFIAESWKALGAVASSLNDFDSAQWYFQKVQHVATRFQNPELMIFFHIFQGELQFKKGEFILATKEFTAALDSLTKHDYKRYRAQALQNIGRSFEWQGNYDNALAYFYDALRIQELMGNRLEVANTYSMMGWAFVNQKDFTKAREMAKKCGANFRLINEGFGISDYYTLSGFIAFQEKNFQESRKFYDSALTIRRQAQVPTLEANVMNFIAQLLIAQRDYDEAMDYEMQVFEIFQKAGNRNGMAVYYNNMSAIMMAKNNLPEAEQYALKAIREATPIRATKHVMTAFINLTEIYNALGKNTEAIRYYKKYVQTSDSLLAAERGSKQAQYNALYTLEKREEEIKRLNQENVMQQTILEVQKSQLRFQNTVLVLAIMTSILLASLAFTLYRFNASKTKANQELSRLNEETVEQKEEIQAQSEELMEANETLVRLNDQLFEKTNEIEAQSIELRETNEMITAINRDLDEIVTRRTSQLNEAYKELDTFFYRSSHDFRRPLTTFMGLAEVASVTVKDRNALDLFDKVKETARSLDKMLVKLQSISDVGAQQLVYKEVLINEIFDNVCQSFRDEIQLKGIKTSCTLLLKDSFISYPAMIKIIVENLVENSIQFSMTEAPYIRLSVSQQENSVLLVMEDNGQGVAKEYAGKVFEMYFRGSERSKGNGLGLYIVKKAVEKLNGSIHLETNYGIGSRFTITLPVHNPESGWSHL